MIWTEGSNYCNTNDAFIGYENGVAIHQLDGTAAGKL